VCQWSVQFPGFASDVLESHDIVARLDVRHTLADRLDNTSTLVSKDNGESTLGILPGECVRIF